MGDDATARSSAAGGRWYFYPRPPYGGRQLDTGLLEDLQPISIHVPRMGDDAQVIVLTNTGVISIHVPRMGDDKVKGIEDFGYGKFLSTSPVWGTTQLITVICRMSLFLSTSPVWGTTPGPDDGPLGFPISIHVPRMGDDWR